MPFVSPRMLKTMIDKLNLNEFQETLNKWRGGNAYIAEFSASHARLVIEIRFNNTDGGLRIISLDTEIIKGLVRWTNCKILIEETQ